jgi:hypothetical protein
MELKGHCMLCATMQGTSTWRSQDRKKEKGVRKEPHLYPGRSRGVRFRGLWKTKNLLVRLLSTGFNKTGFSRGASELETLLPTYAQVYKKLIVATGHYQPCGKQKSAYPLGSSHLDGLRIP